MYPELRQLRNVTIAGLIACIVATLIVCMACGEEIGIASWYDRASCKREGTSGIMSNGEVLDDNKLTCASWNYDFGVLVRVVNLSNNKEVICKVTDRGPAKRLVKKGRICDLSKRAFSQIASLEQGLIRVSVQKINH